MGLDDDVRRVRAEQAAARDAETQARIREEDKIRGTASLICEFVTRVAMVGVSLTPMVDPKGKYGRVSVEMPPGPFARTEPPMNPHLGFLDAARYRRKWREAQRRDWEERVRLHGGETLESGAHARWRITVSTTYSDGLPCLVWVDAVASPSRRKLEHDLRQFYVEHERVARDLAEALIKLGI